MVHQAAPYHPTAPPVSWRASVAEPVGRQGGPSCGSEPQAQRVATDREAFVIMQRCQYEHEPACSLGQRRPKHHQANDLPLGSVTCTTPAQTVPHCSGSLGRCPDLGSQSPVECSWRAVAMGVLLALSRFFRRTTSKKTATVRPARGAVATATTLRSHLSLSVPNPVRNTSEHPGQATSHKHHSPHPRYPKVRNGARPRDA